jgi:hypothetical protein
VFFFFFSLSLSLLFRFFPFSLSILYYATSFVPFSSSSSFITSNWDKKKNNNNTLKKRRRKTKLVTTILLWRIVGCHLSKHIYIQHTAEREREREQLNSLKRMAVRPSFRLSSARLAYISYTSVDSISSFRSE